jgi:hypothetical protein
VSTLIFPFGLRFVYLFAFHFSISSRPILGPTQPPSQKAQVAFSPGGKAAMAWSWSSPSSSAEVKKTLVYKSTSSYVIMVEFLVMHKDNLTSTFTFPSVCIIWVRLSQWLSMIWRTEVQSPKWAENILFAITSIPTLSSTQHPVQQISMCPFPLSWFSRNSKPWNTVLARARNNIPDPTARS